MKIALIAIVVIAAIGGYFVYQNHEVNNVKSQFLIKEFSGKKLKYQVIKPDSIMGASATLIVNKKHALLVDTQFSQKDGENIVKLAKAQNLKIDKVYISYSDPDYYFGASAIKDAYPNAKIIATAATIARIKETYKDKQSVWKSTLGKELPKNVIIPKEVEKNISFGGQNFTIFGSDPKKQTLYSKDDSILIAGPLVNTGSHLFMADTKSLGSQQKWVNDLSEIQALRAKIVIPSHFGKHETFNKNSILFTKNYINNFMSAVKTSSSSKEIIQKMKEKYPKLPMGSLEQSAKVVTGEETWK